MTNRRTKFENYVDEEANRKNTTKARVRDKVEHPFRILKRIFGFAKVRYRGLWKNHQWLCAAFALVNLYAVSYTHLEARAGLGETRMFWWSSVAVCTAVYASGILILVTTRILLLRLRTTPVEISPYARSQFSSSSSWARKH